MKKWILHIFTESYDHAYKLFKVKPTEEQIDKILDEEWAEDQAAETVYTELIEVEEL